MSRLLLVLVALCGLASAQTSSWATPFPVSTAATAADCFASSAIDVTALQYATTATTNSVSDTTVSAKMEYSCNALYQYANGNSGNLPSWFSAIYSDRVWAVDRMGNGACLQVQSIGNGLSGASTISADTGASFRPAGSDQTYQMLLTRELFGCQYDSNPDNTATQNSKTASARPVTAWRGERFNIFRSDGYNKNSFTSTTGPIGVGFFNVEGTQLTWENPTNAGMNTKWAAPFAASCSGIASTLIYPPGCLAAGTDCNTNQQIANIACASSSVFFAHSGQSSYPCGATNSNGLSSNNAICTTRSKPSFGLDNQIWGSQGIWTWMLNYLQPKITQFQGQTTNGWALDTSRKFYVTDNQQITVSLSGTASTANQGRVSASATNNQIFNNKVFIDTTIGVSTSSPAVSLNQIDYNSNTNQATFRAANGKCQTPATGNAATKCGDQTTGFEIGQQYWAVVQSSYTWTFVPACSSITDTAANYPYIYLCGNSYTGATTNGATYNNADNNYPTSQRSYPGPDALNPANNANKQTGWISSSLFNNLNIQSDPVYLGFVSYAANEEFDVADNWVAETRNFALMGTEDRNNTSVSNPIYATNLLNSESQWYTQESAKELAEKSNNLTSTLAVAANDLTAARTQAEKDYFMQQVAVEQLKADNAKAAADAADKRAETYNYAMGLVGAGIVVFAVFFLVAVCTFSAAYVKANQGKDRNLTGGDLTFTKTEMSRT